MSQKTWCGVGGAGQMKSPQSTNVGFCAVQVTVAKVPFHTAELEIGLTVAKSTLPNPCHRGQGNTVHT